MRIAILFLAAVLFGTFTVSARADNATPVPATSAAPAKSFSDADKAAIEEIIQNYLVKEHPEVLAQAMQELQKREQDMAATKSEAAIKSASDKIFNNPDTPVGGNPKGDVTLVEFFDYQCGYCKMAEPEVQKLLKEDKNVKVIYKDFPILGPISTQSAKVAMAANRQSTAKYIKLHDALMAQKEHLTEDMVYKAAKESGLDVEKLKKDMADDTTAKQIQANLDLGAEVGVRGTPMFIIGENVYPGAMQYDQLKKAVDDARATAKKN